MTTRSATSRDLATDSYLVALVWARFSLMSERLRLSEPPATTIPLDCAE